ncbi:MAG TPA: hypothetical protein PKN44_15675 [Bacteroidales bacterium]|nr:hypothetical protein [Bacteroidales bacterium]
MSKDKKPTQPCSEDGKKTVGSTTEKCPLALKTNLGEKIDKAIDKCPKFAENLKKLQNEGWSFEYGEKGKGSYCQKSAKKIVIDADEKNNTALVVQTMAHESGHAMYKADPYVPPDGLTKADYASKNANSSLKDEGEATLTNIEMKKCLKDNGGISINVAGVNAKKYEKIAEKYPDSKDRDKARQEIGDIFADGEHPSTAPDKTYRQNYEQPYLDYYDKWKNNNKA